MVRERTRAAGCSGYPSEGLGLRHPLAQSCKQTQHKASQVSQLTVDWAAMAGARVGWGRRYQLVRLSYCGKAL